MNDVPKCSLDRHRKVEAALCGLMASDAAARALLTGEMDHDAVADQLVKLADATLKRMDKPRGT